MSTHNSLGIDLSSWLTIQGGHPNWVYLGYLVKGSYGVPHWDTNLGGLDIYTASVKLEKWVTFLTEFIFVHNLFPAMFCSVDGLWLWVIAFEYLPSQMLEQKT